MYLLEDTETLEGPPFDPTMDDAEGKMLLDEAIQELGLQELPKEYFNPNHQPAGSEKGGEFAPKAGDSGTNTDTPAFKKWFGDSKVVDSDGKPLVVYHGARAGQDFFTIKNDQYKTGLMASSSMDTAQSFATWNKGVVYPLYLKIQKPFVVDAKGEGYFDIPMPKEMRKDWVGEKVDTDGIADWAHKHGYDGAIIRNVFEGNLNTTWGDNYIIFSPSQAKSVSNKGSFDPKDKRISYTQRAKTTYERRVDFKLAKHRLDVTETKVKERLKAQLRQVQDSLIAWTRITTLDSNTVRYLPVASLPEFQRTLQDMFEQAWTHGRDAGVRELPRKVKKRPSLQAVRTFAWDFCPCWSEDAEWHLSAVDYAEWDESQHKRHPKGTEAGGEFAPESGDKQLMPWLSDKEKHLDLPIAKGLKKAPLVKAGPLEASFGDCTNCALNFHRTQGGDLYVGTIVVKESLAENREWIKTPGHTGLVTGISHAWNVKDGKIYDTTLGSKEAADYLYFGFKVPDDVVKNLKNGDELANWHTSQMKYAQWDESKHPRSPTFNPADKRISYANAFEPTEAMKAFENRAWMIKDVIDSRLQSAVRQELFEHLKGGRTMGDTISRLRDIFAPYVGDPSSGAPGSLLSAARLENIVRTETTWAYNQGRLAVGDALGDYILGYQFSAILDERTTETCQTADGLVLQKDDATTIQLTPPLHFQCRSMLVYVTVDDAPVEWSGDKEIDAAVSLIQAGFK